MDVDIADSRPILDQDASVAGSVCAESYDRGVTSPWQQSDGFLRTCRADVDQSSMCHSDHETGAPGHITRHKHSLITSE